MKTTTGRLPVLATLIGAILFVFAFAFASGCDGGLQSDRSDLGLVPDLTETPDLAQSDWVQVSTEDTVSTRTEEGDRRALLLIPKYLLLR